MGQSGSVDYLFKQIGEIFIEPPTDQNEDELMMAVLDAGALDFVSSSEGVEIVTEPADFTKVLDSLNGQTILEAELTMRPLTTVPPLTAASDIKAFEKMIDLLEDDDDVQSVYHNLELQELQ